MICIPRTSPTTTLGQKSFCIHTQKRLDYDSFVWIDVLKWKIRLRLRLTGSREGVSV